MDKSVQTRLPKTFYNEKDKIWHGASVKPTFGSKDSIGAVAIECLLKDPDHIAQICYPSNREYTNGEIAQRSIRVALNLEQLNLEQCEVIGLCASNSDYIAPLVFGAMLCGLTISTLDPSFDKDGIKHTYSITKPKLMFCDGNIYQTVKQALDECNLSSTAIYTLDNHLDGIPNITVFLKEHKKENDFRAPDLRDGSDQVAMILCSSGTTGLPKGVTMSHSRLLNACELPMLPTDKYLCFSTLYWLSGLITLLHTTIKNSIRIISNRPFTPNDFFDIVERYRVNVVITPPSCLAMTLATTENLKNIDLSSIRTYAIGGSAVQYFLIEKFKQYAPNSRFMNFFGMSEVTTFISCCEITSSNPVGQLNINTEVKIINEDGENLSIDEIGEICIRTKYPWTGYVNNDEATKATYDQDGWLHSGDIGYFDANGYLYIVDRIKDIFKYKNFHFYPTAIEKVINELPDVADVCVVGLDDIVATHLPAAAVVRLPQSKLTEHEIYQRVADRMQNFEHLRGGIYFFDRFPQTVSGKTIRRKVTEMCENIRKDNLVLDK